MKKKITYLLMIFSIFLCGKINVNAQDYRVMELIPVDTVASVSTDRIGYGDFVYNSAVDSKGNAVINFNAITNYTLEKTSVTINMLLFDENKKNIGFLTYCSKKDLDSDYYGAELAPKQISPFSIKVTKRYFGDKALAGNVKYVAVFDDNKYCHIGGYTKYVGLTIDEILSGKVTSTVTSDSDIDPAFVNALANKSTVITILLVVLGVLIACLVINGLILNALYKRMYAKTTPMAYLPILSNYVAVKLSFGEMVAKMYLVCFFAAAALSFFGINILTMAVSLVGTASFIIVIIKLITKKYDLFYYEPSIKNNINTRNSSNSSNQSVSNTSINTNSTSTTPNNFFNGQVDNSFVEEVDKNDVVDLNYSDVNPDFSSSFMNNNINSAPTSDNNLESAFGANISSGSSNISNNISSGEVNLNSNNINDNSTNLTNSSNSGEESDLSKLFK